MHPARIAELLEPFLTAIPNNFHSESGRRAGEEPAVLSATQLQNISTYIDILLRWNARINLTAIRNPEEIVTRHFGESLFAARHLFPLYPVSSSVSPVPSVVKDFDPANDRRPTTNGQVADVGSGAGFPGIPIKLWARNIALTLIESNQKKAAFLKEVARSLILTNINIQNARAEDLPSDLSFDIVTLRAVERFVEVLPAAARLMAPSGRLALLLGSSQLDHVHSYLPNLSWSDPLPIPMSQSRSLLIGRREPAE